MGCGGAVGGARRAARRGGVSGRGDTVDILRRKWQRATDEVTPPSTPPTAAVPTEIFPASPSVPASARGGGRRPLNAGTPRTPPPPRVKISSPLKNAHDTVEKDPFSTRRFKMSDVPSHVPSLTDERIAHDCRLPRYRRPHEGAGRPVTRDKDWALIFESSPPEIFSNPRVSIVLVRRTTRPPSVPLLPPPAHAASSPCP